MVASYQTHLAGGRRGIGEGEPGEDRSGVGSEGGKDGWEEGEGVRAEVRNGERVDCVRALVFKSEGAREKVRETVRETATESNPCSRIIFLP